MAELVERFFAEEVTDRVRSVLDQEIRNRTTGSRYFTFNVFNVRLDFDQGLAVVEDELDPSRTESLTLDAFQARLVA